MKYTYKHFNDIYMKTKKTSYIPKKTSDLHISRALVLGAVFTSCYAVTAFAQQGIVNTDDVYLRTEASPEASIIGYMSIGDEVEITSLVGDYYQVTYNGQERLYIHSQYLDIEDMETARHLDAGISDTIQYFYESEPEVTETTAPIEEGSLESFSRTEEVYAPPEEENVETSEEVSLESSDEQSSGAASEPEGENVSAVNSDNAYLRTEANPDSSIIGILNTGDKVEVTSLDGDYYQVTYNGQERLYIHTEYLDVSAAETTAPIEAENTESSSGAEQIFASYAVVKSSGGLNLRSGPSLGSGIILTLPNGAAVDVVEAWPNWTKVNYNGTEGYMKSEFVELHTGQKPQQTQEVAAPAANSSLASQVVAYSKRFLGTPYRWGGTALGRGVDCSGFVYAVYRNFGVNLNRTSSGMASNGVRVNKANLQPGDLVLFTSGSTNGRIGHVGMYIGNGQFIHSASGKRSGVIISNLNESYYQRTYVTARRVI